MKAEPLNIVLRKYNNINSILDFYDSNLEIEKLECRVWRPSFSDKEFMGEEEYNKQVAEWKLTKDTLLFKNVFLSWESCCCGDSGYGCSCGDYVTEIMIMKPEQVPNHSDLVNRIQNKAKKEKLEDNSWAFSLEDKNYYSDDIPNGTFQIPMPKTIGEFINDCERIGAELIWNDWVVNNYFKSKNVIEEKKKEVQLHIF